MRPVSLARVVLAEGDAAAREALAKVLAIDGYAVIQQDFVQENTNASLLVAHLGYDKNAMPQLLTRLGRMKHMPVVVVGMPEDAALHAQARTQGVAAIFNGRFEEDDFRTAVMTLISRPAHPGSRAVS